MRSSHFITEAKRTLGLKGYCSVREIGLSAYERDRRIVVVDIPDDKYYSAGSTYHLKSSWRIALTLQWFEYKGQRRLIGYCRNTNELYICM